MLCFSAVISASEVAFFSLKSTDVDFIESTDDAHKDSVKALLRRPRRLLATILIMNNFVNVGIVTISTFLLWEMVQTKNPTDIMVGIGTFVTTFAITFFGEIIPKVYATQQNIRIAKYLASTWQAIEIICFPISIGLIKMSNVIEGRVKKRGYSGTVEELNQALELTIDESTSEDEKEILKGILNFGTLTVKQIMHSRTEIFALNIELNFKELLTEICDSGFSRLPVYRDNLDHIEGILYTKDLLPYLNEDEHFDWKKLLRPGFFVPENKKLDSLLNDFQKKHVHMAIVSDEYSGNCGIITLEDLIEEIIGEINDEFDEVQTQFQKVDDNTYIFEGKISLNDFCKALDIDNQYFDSVKGESESLAGLMLELNNSLPSTGTVINYKRFGFTIVAVDNKRIKKICVTFSNDKLGK